METEEKRMIDSYEIEQSIHIGSEETVFGVSKKDEYPFMVCSYSYNNPLGVAWAEKAIVTDDFLEAMSIFTERVQEQIGQVKKEHEKFAFDMKAFTREDCIPDDKSSSIIGKVVVVDAEVNRYEYRHSAYQLILAEGGHGADGRRGQAVFGINLADGRRARWERSDILGELKSGRMPEWAKEALEKIRTQKKEKEREQREER